MADFTQTSTVRIAVRNLTNPINSLTSFTALIQDILDNYPWGCTTYERSGVTLPAVSKSSESYSGRVIYENAEAKTIGFISVKAPTSSAYH
ncbi:hypothetical protein [Methanospirillum lacunae]|uniref:hypothetical protein n=1 Tax=Methanospirillum lacunae TaxID=668570 RepID=UPI001FE7AAEE|nr:hypothetical protein [Methanospirillum lacunae]